MLQPDFILAYFYKNFIEKQDSRSARSPHRPGRWIGSKVVRCGCKQAQIIQVKASISDVDRPSSTS